MAKFVPRTSENGKICCSPSALCDACKAHFQSLDGTPPDPYATGLATLRAANAVAATTITPEERESLGSYADGVAQLRAAMRT